MHRFSGRSLSLPASCLALCLLAGCGGKSGQAPAEPPANQKTPPPDTVSKTGDGTGGTISPSSNGNALRKPLSFGGTVRGTPSVTPGNNAGSTAAGSNPSGVHEALKPLQIVLGQWNGTTRRKNAKGFNNRETVEWVWDLSTDKQQPALVMKAVAAPAYFREGRLTYLTDSRLYRFTATDTSGSRRVYEGTLTKPVREVPGDGKRMEKTFELTLKQVSPRSQRKLAQLVLRQQKNDRYLFDVYDFRGSQVALADTVNTMRDGYSFAKRLDEYGDKTCVVSQGLGTTPVSYQGKTYYVCCSGCKAAFEEEPEKWIASFEEWKKKNNK